jgi:hypothetical protein
VTKLLVLLLQGSGRAERGRTPARAAFNSPPQILASPGLSLHPFTGGPIPAWAGESSCQQIGWPGLRAPEWIPATLQTPPENSGPWLEAHPSRLDAGARRFPFLSSAPPGGGNLSLVARPAIRTDLCILRPRSSMRGPLSGVSGRPHSSQRGALPDWVGIRVSQASAGEQRVVAVTTIPALMTGA